MSPHDFLKQFLPAYELGDRAALHRLCRDIYEETIRIVRQGSYTTETGKPVSLPAPAAWGCGAFRNPPRHIAELFHQVMEEAEFRNRFRKIVFAIIDRSKLETGHGKTGNFLPFQEEFRPARKPGPIPPCKDTPKELFNRFKGMFWGLVVGDCLGSPIQFMPKDGHPHITDMVRCDTFNTPPGYWTDDSSMAFCIAESVIRRGRYDLADIADNFVRWLDEGFWSSLSHAFDVGGATRASIGGIRRGSLKNGGKDSQGNGSIMRFAPSWILNYGNPDRTILYEISDLTHNSSAVRETIDLMTDICDAHVQGKRTTTASIYQTREEVGNSGWAVSTLQAALWAFQSTDSFEDGMIAAVNLGGDADSIGAVYGQIAGLYYGYNAIPERWLAAIKDREKVNELIEQFISMKK